MVRAGATGEGATGEGETGEGAAGAGATGWVECKESSGSCGQAKSSGVPNARDPQLPKPQPKSKSSKVPHFRNPLPTSVDVISVRLRGSL